MTLTFSLGSIGTGIHPTKSIVYWNAYVLYTPIDITFRPGTNNFFNTNVIFAHDQQEHILVILDDAVSILGLTLLQTSFISNSNDELILTLFNNTNANIIISQNTVFAEIVGIENLTNRAVTLYDYNLQQQQLDEQEIITLAGVGKLLVQTYGDSNFNGRITSSEYLQSIDLNRFDPKEHITNYGIEIIGYIYPAYTETYTFYITSKDKIRFWVNDELLLHDWTVSIDTEQTSSTIDLTANTYYPIYIQQAEIAGDNQRLIVQWGSTSQTKEIIPSSKFATHENQVSSFINKLEVADNIQVFNSATTTQQLMKLNINTTGQLQFSYNGTDIGYIATSGINTLMNFTGQHRSFTNDTNINTTPSNYIGLIVSTTGVIKNLNDESTSIDSALPVVALSTEDNDKKVFGVIAGKEDNSITTRSFQVGIFSTYYNKITDDERLFINSLGEGMVWVVDKGGNLTNGDLITTSTAIGYGQLQSDDIIRNYTLGKITQDCDFDTLTITRWVNLIGTEIDQTTYDSNPSAGHRAVLCACVYYCG